MTEAYQDQLTCIANDGWERPEARCPHLATSACADAWHVGQYLRREGKPRPSVAKASRGNSIRINRHHVFKLDYARNGSVTVLPPA